MKNTFQRILSQQLKHIFKEYTILDNGLGVLETGEYEFRYSAQITSIAGEIILRPFITLSCMAIEKQWLMFKEELMIEQLYNPTTIILTTKDYHTSLPKENNELEVTSLNETEFKELVNNLFADYMKSEINNFTNLKNCDLLLNKSFKIDDSNIPYSDIQSLPFRKVFLAKATNNTSASKIEEEMRSYCEEQYELGKREDFEQLCRLKQVFEKLFNK